MEIVRSETTYRKAGTSPSRWAGLLMVNYPSVEDCDGPCVTQLVDETGEVKEEIFWSSCSVSATKITRAENDFRRLHAKVELTEDRAIKLLKVYES